MEGTKRRRCPWDLIFLSIFFIVVAVAEGVLVWKLTKDAYETSDSRTCATSETSVTSKPVVQKQEDDVTPWLSYRLPRDVLPVHYDVTIYPNFYEEAHEFSGNVTIEAQVVTSTHYIILHAHPLYVNVTGTHVTDNTTGAEIDVIRTFYHTPHEFFVIQVGRDVNDSVRLTLKYHGVFDQTTVGFYKSDYYNTDTNQTRNVVTTKLQPNFARRAFPCFDEPNIKAEFTITLIHRPEYIALSNMPQDGETSDWNTGLVSTKFQRSPKMSTYLVCLVICDFNYTETRTRSGVPIRVFAASDRIEQTLYSLDLANFTLEKFQELFNMSYPLPKLDLVALPEFEWGGMENWGLITFKESTILYSPEVSPLTANEDVAQTVCHEISHMWFGNIVTMDWWNDLWLNEGFASYIEYVGVALKEPDWEILTKFLDKYYFLAMKIDSKVGTHPIVMDVQTTTDFTQSFDEIMYYKGSSIIRMLKSMMGDELFYSGVANYLKKFQWGNAKTDDLWNSLSDVDHRHDVKHIMDTWILQDGFPFINVTFTRDNSGKTLVTASQSRFLGNPTAIVEASSSPLGYKWFVELTYKTSAGLSGTQSMDMNDTTFTLDLDIENDMTWVKFNTDQMGYYIVLYPPDMWRKLLNYLLTTPVANWTLSASDRAGLLNDAFSLANAGKLSYELPLELMAYLDREGDYVVWSTAVKSGINPISQMLYTPQWKNFVKNISQSVIEKLGFEDKGSNTERLLRNMLWNLAVSSNYTPVIENLSSKFRGWLDNGTSVSPNQKHTVYTVGMMFAGTEQDWDVIWQKYLVEPSPHEKDLLMYALATTRQRSRVDKLLGYLKDEVGIKRQDFATVTQILGMNSVANPMLWDWIRKNYQFFIDRFTIDDLRFGEVVYDTVKLYSTREKLQQVKDFFAQYPDAGASEGHRRLAIDSIEKNIYWAEHFKPVIVDWLERRHL